MAKRKPIIILNRILEVLKEKEVTRYKLAKDLDISPPSVYKWCDNKIQPSLENLCKMAAILNVPTGSLIAKENPYAKKEIQESEPTDSNTEK